MIDILFSNKQITKQPNPLFPFQSSFIYNKTSKWIFPNIIWDWNLVNLKENTLETYFLGDAPKRSTYSMVNQIMQMISIYLNMWSSLSTWKSDTILPSMVSFNSSVSLTFLFSLNICNVLNTSVIVDNITNEIDINVIA